MKTIFDPIRNKEVAETPEERVRQHIIRWLLEDRKLPKHWSRVEYQLPDSTYYADFVAHYKESEKARPQGVLLAEFKEPGVPINQLVFDQLNRYLQKEKFAFAMLSNGKEFYFLDCRSNEIKSLEELPTWEEMLALIKS